MRWSGKTSLRRFFARRVLRLALLIAVPTRVVLIFLRPLDPLTVCVLPVILRTLSSPRHNHADTDSKRKDERDGDRHHKDFRAAVQVYRHHHAHMRLGGRGNRGDFSVIEKDDALRLAHLYDYTLHFNSSVLYPSNSNSAILFLIPPP